ncbi:MAG TPA: caspase family protein [Trebonia sp.]|jgi:WD40 repeat protein|nr:caspase family protein [Trebonia sp.]
MAADVARRRYLIAVGITAGLSTSGPQIIASVNQMVETLCGDFGYERVTTLDIDPPREQIRKEIREFCVRRDPDDVVVLYYTGHADELNERHRVWTGDTVDPVSDPLETWSFAEWMLLRTPLRHALIILDTCFAGRGGAEALRASVSSMSEGDGKTLAVLTAAYPREQIVAGDFARLFTSAVNRRAVAGHEPPVLTLGAIAGVIDADPTRPGWQTVSQSVLFGKTDQLPFFPNPRYNPRLQGLDLLTQLRIEQRELRLADLKGHFLPRARGVDVPAEPGWRFVGREAALRDLVSWLSDADDRSARVVTGGPGSGKSAVVGRLVVLSDRDWRRTVPLDDLAPDTIPPEESIAVGIHARGMTTAQVLAAICAEAGVRADTPADLLREMRGKKLTVAVDAIDEALDPVGLVASVLRPLAEAGPAEGLRLLLGTRPHLVDALAMTDAAVDLDDERYADPESIYEYVRRGLTPDDEASPYQSVPAERVEAIARAVAEAAGHSFLVALIVTRTLHSRQQVPDPADPRWRASLPGTAADAMHDDLETRLGPEAERARDLLRPLAFAAGAGLPWEDVWAPLASRLSERSYSDEDLVWLRRHAGSYVVEAMEAGHSVYRLYHASLAEYLRQDGDDKHAHEAFAAFLATRVPISRVGPDWSRAHPYILAHLATHARRAGALDSLLLDPGYLVCAAPAGLLAALPGAEQADARLAAAAYQRSVHQFRNQPLDYRLSYLELAARITRAERLASRIRELAPHRPWAVPWTQWPAEYPHRLLASQLGPVSGVTCVDQGQGRFVAVSVGVDAKLRLWDIVTGESDGEYQVGNSPLLSVRAVRLSVSRTVLLMTAVDGSIPIWDMSTATLLRTIHVVPAWRRLLRLWGQHISLRCFSVPGGQQYAVAGGTGLRTSVFSLPSGRRVAEFPSRVTVASVGCTRLIDERIVLVGASGDGYWLVDPATGEELPRERARRLPPWLRGFWETIRGTGLSYYALRGGPPAIAVRFFRGRAEVWDLTQSLPLGTWPRRASAQRPSVRLRDGQEVTVPLPQARARAPRQAPPPEPNSVVPLGSQEAGAMLPAHDSQVEPEWGRPVVRGRFLQVALRASGAVVTLAGHTAEVTGYDWAQFADGRVVIVTVSQDGTVRSWDISSIGRDSRPADDEARIALNRVHVVPFPDGIARGLTIDNDSGLTLWDLRNGTLIGTIDDEGPPFSAAAIAHRAGHDPVAVTFGLDNMLRVHGLPDGRKVAEYPADRVYWPSGAACAHLPDGTPVVVTTGHRRKTVIWDLASGRMRHVMSGHRGWSSSVACFEDRRHQAAAVTGGHDNRVNIWDVRHGWRRRRLRIVPLWAFLVQRAAGMARDVCGLEMPGGKLLVLVATADGMVRALQSRRWGTGTRRLAVVSAGASTMARLSTGAGVVVTGGADGTVRVWQLEDFYQRKHDPAPLCEINIDVPVTDVAILDPDSIVLATPNGLTAVQLDARLLLPDAGRTRLGIPDSGGTLLSSGTRGHR